MKIRVVGLLIFLLVVMSCIAIGRGPLRFFHLPSIGFVILASCGLALMKHRKGDGKSTFLTSIKRYSIPAGVIGCVIGLVQLGQNVSDPTHIPGGVAVAVLTIFYGLILYCIVDTFIVHEHPGS